MQHWDRQHTGEWGCAAPGSGVIDATYHTEMMYEAYGMRGEQLVGLDNLMHDASRLLFLPDCLVNTVVQHMSPRVLAPEGRFSEWVSVANRKAAGCCRAIAMICCYFA